MTIDGLADALGVSRATVLRWETGSVRPSPLSADRLRDLGIDVRTEETNVASRPLIDAAPETTRDMRRSNIRPTITIAGVDSRFEPAPYVFNGPPDQQQFFEQLFKIQSQRAVAGEDPRLSADRLSLVAELPDIELTTAQHVLEGPRSDRKSWNSNYGSHGWHRYVGRFPPHVVRALLHGFGATRGDTLCDPFAGSGTALVEARLLGLKAIGVEISPLSALISRTKAAFPEDPDEILQLQDLLARVYPEKWADFVEGQGVDLIPHSAILDRPGNPIGDFANLPQWFTPEAFLGSSIVAELICELSGYQRDALAVALSAKMRSIGNVDVDVVRAEFRKEARLGVDVLNLVQRQLRKMVDDIIAMQESHCDLIGPQSSVVVHEESILDARIPEGSVDFIITSPPYGVESLSYLRTHLLSFRVLESILGIDPYRHDERVIGSEYLGAAPAIDDNHAAARASSTFASFFGSLSKQSVDISKRDVDRMAMMMHFFDETVAVTERFSSWLRPGGKGAIVIGNKRLGSELIPTATIVTELLNAAGLRVDDTLKHKLKTNNSNSQVPWQERIIQDEYIILFSRR